MRAHYSLICLERSILSGYWGWILFVFFETSLKLAFTGLFNRQTKAFQLLWNISKAVFLCSLCFNKRMWLKEIMVFLSWERCKTIKQFLRKFFSAIFFPYSSPCQSGLIISQFEIKLLLITSQQVSLFFFLLPSPIISVMVIFTQNHVDIQL